MQAGTVRNVVHGSTSYGNYVVIDEGNGVLRQYSHLSKIAVSPGDAVGKGTPFALSGNTGKSTGPHLDVKKFVNGVPVDWAVEIGEVASGRRASGRPPKGGGGTEQWRQYVEKWAPEFGVPVNVAMAVMRQESGGNPRSKSGKGAMGLFQLMPGTARALGVDASNPLENIRGGLKYLGQQFKRFGNWEESLAAYNAGPGNVASGKWHKFAETRNYVKNVLAMAGGAAPVGPKPSDPMPPASTQDAMKQMAALMPDEIPDGPAIDWSNPWASLAQTEEPQAPSALSQLSAMIGPVSTPSTEPVAQEEDLLGGIDWSDPWSSLNG
jgi:hypothetical protein